MVASVGISLAVSAQAGTANTITVTNQSGSAIVNYPFQFGRPFIQGAIPHAPAVLVNGATVLSQADIKNRYPDGSVEFAVLSVVLPSLPAGTPVVLSFSDTLTNSNAGLTSSEMLDSSYNFDATISAIPVSGTVGTASARAMLANDSFTVWASGPVAQTIMLADDSAVRQYDIGFDGVHHPLRPRFYATFWPALNEVFVRVVGENATTTEIGDLAYNLSVSAGFVSPATVYTADLTGTQATHPKAHWALSNWSRTFWLGSTPSPQVNIDFNLAYLASTRWLANYDTSIVPTQALLANEYTLWTGKPHDLYDGAWNGGEWQAAMGAEGERQEIGPYPVWDVLWLYTGDWRMRQMALGLDDLAASWPANLRETALGKRLSTKDAAGSSTGLGHMMSIADRKTIALSGGLTYSGTAVGDRVTIVGTKATQPWTFNSPHQPQCWFVPYMLTGDPWYLNQAYLWAGYTAAEPNGAATPYSYGRGPTGAEGVLTDELRGGGWDLRGRAETALMAPDADPEKAWLVQLTKDALARWEGGLGITGTVFDGTAVKNWGALRGNYYSNNQGPHSAQPPLLGNWEANGNPTAVNSTINQNESEGVYVPGAVGNFTSPWMQNYVLYALGRAGEIGFATGPLLAHTGAWLTGLITETGYPELVVLYQQPVEAKGGGFFATWPALVAALEPAWLTGTGWVGGPTEVGPLSSRFALNLNAAGYAGWAVAGASFVPAAWSWMLPNVYQAIPDWASNVNDAMKWAILPRTDTNVLPGF